jgi:formate/nitrite transporter FocA (FNT family)
MTVRSDGRQRRAPPHLRPERLPLLLDHRKTKENQQEPIMTKLNAILAAIALTLSIGFATTASAAPEGFNNFDGSACYCVDP